MVEIEIFLDDLKDEKKQEVLEALGGEVGNYDIFPLTTVVFEDEE